MQKLQSSPCAICDRQGNATELYKANFNQEALDSSLFSARRLPDRVRYRMVRCNTCGLVRADPVLDADTINQFYAKSSFDYTDELDNLGFTYGHYLAKLLEYGAKKESLLEIGCGNGFLLEEALKQGYARVKGVEPSLSAVAKARPDLRPDIVCEPMRPGLFRPQDFDVICIFQVLDHIYQPGILLEECFRLLKPGGLLLCLNHNIGSISAKILKSRSPIVDIEHPYLYDINTLSRLLKKYGLNVKTAGPVFNRYSLYYIIRLIPLPDLLKNSILALLKKISLGRCRLSVPLGNLYLIAQRS